VLFTKSMGQDHQLKTRLPLTLLPAWSDSSDSSHVADRSRPLSRRLSTLTHESTTSVDEKGRRRSWSADPDVAAGDTPKKPPMLCLCDPEPSPGLRTPPSERSSSFRSREARARRRRNSLSSPVDDFCALTEIPVKTQLTNIVTAGSSRSSRRQSAPAMVITTAEKVQLATKELRWLNLSELVEVMRRLRLSEHKIDSCLDKHVPHDIDGARDLCSQAIIAQCKNGDFAVPVPVPPPSPTRGRASSTPLLPPPGSPVSDLNSAQGRATVCGAMETLQQGVVIC